MTCALQIAQQLWENARYAKNSINANIPKNQQHEILPINIKGWESLRKGNRERVNIMEVIYQHCSFVRDKYDTTVFNLIQRADSC